VRVKDLQQPLTRLMPAYRLLPGIGAKRLYPDGRQTSDVFLSKLSASVILCVDGVLVTALIFFAAAAAADGSHLGV